MRRWLVFTVGALLGACGAAVPATAQQVLPRRVIAPADVPKAGSRSDRSAPERTILFVGNSFTQGAHSAVQRYRADSVTDLNGDGYGGVPALFKTFTEQARLNWRVALETQGGTSLAYHWQERRARLKGRYDVVVLQEYSTLDRERPGDATSYLRHAPLLAAMARAADPRVTVLLMATWSRADLVWQPGSPWSGRPIGAMAIDLRAAADRVQRASRDINGVIPVGEAWNRAFAARVADPNPYDGVAFGELNLWAYDHYHASAAGSYLEALVVFGKVTGIDPRTLGAGERAADDLGLSREQATRLQAIAAEELSATRPYAGRRE